MKENEWRYQKISETNEGSIQIHIDHYSDKHRKKGWRTKTQNITKIYKQPSHCQLFICLTHEPKGERHTLEKRVKMQWNLVTKWKAWTNMCTLLQQNPQIYSYSIEIAMHECNHWVDNYLSSPPDITHTHTHTQMNAYHSYKLTENHTRMTKAHKTSRTNKKERKKVRQSERNWERENVKNLRNDKMTKWQKCSSIKKFVCWIRYKTKKCHQITNQKFWWNKRANNAFEKK